MPGQASGILDSSRVFLIARNVFFSSKLEHAQPLPKRWVEGGVSVQYLLQYSAQVSDQLSEPSQHRPQTPRASGVTREAGFTLVEMMMVLGLLGLAALAASTILNRMAQTRLDAMSFASLTSESKIMTNFVKRRFLTRVGGNDGVCAASSPFIPNTAPGVGFCIENCTTLSTTVKQNCKTFTIRRGSAALIEDTTWRTSCVAAPAALSGRLQTAGGQFPSMCGLNCPAGQVPRVLISTRKLPVPGAETIATRMIPANFGLPGGAPSLTSAIGSEMCMTIIGNNATNLYGTVVVSGRVYGFGMGDAQTRRVRFEDASVTFPELVLANDSLIFQVDP
jgi:prepilin-type N-terminal cleavage/methylation domain-containing protein